VTNNQNENKLVG